MKTLIKFWILILPLLQISSAVYGFKSGPGVLEDILVWLTISTVLWFFFMMYFMLMTKLFKGVDRHEF